MLSPLPSRIQRVLVHRTGHLGDTVCAIPAFRLLRRHFADAELVMLCDRPSEQKVAAWDVVTRLEVFDRLISYDSGKGWRTPLELFKQIRRLAPDVVVQLPQMDRTARSIATQRLFFRLAGVRCLVGFRPWDCLLEWQPNEPHRLIQLLNDEGIPGSKPPYAIPLDQGPLASLREKLENLDVDLEQPYLVFCGGGKTATQRWPLGRYAQVLSNIRRHWKIPVIAVGSPQELTAYRREVLPIFPQLQIPRSGLLIIELVELLRFALAYLGNDTGPMHLAAAVDCPVATVISARNKPGRWDPDVTRRLIIRHRTPCEGCRLSECLVEQHRCMTAIDTQRVEGEVFGFLHELLTQRRSGVLPQAVP
jgi:ADP-heptose:LPS heptosyltransferase